MNVCRNKTSYVKRLTAVLVAALFIIQLFALNAFAAENNKCGDDLKWTLEGGVLTISGKGDMSDFRDGSFAPWYESASEIRSIVLPKGLTGIGDFAFFGCSEVTSVTLPDNIGYIGDYAFAGCTSLLKINFPEGLEKIGNGAFRECEVLCSVRFPSTLRVISSMAFYRCYGLMSVEIPSSVTELGVQAFTYCTGLVRATVRANISVLPEWCFYGCTRLADVILDSVITSVDEYSFQRCPALHTVYTEIEDPEASYALQQSVMANNPDFAASGLVSEQEPPATSSSTAVDGSAFIESQISETGNSVITVTKTTELPDASGSSGSDTTKRIDAVIENDDGWNELIEMIDCELEKGYSSNLSVNVIANGNAVSKDTLSKLAGKNVELSVSTTDGTVWHIDLSKTAEKDVKKAYDLGVTLTEQDVEKLGLGGYSAYLINFASDTAFDSTVGIRLPAGAEYQTATLYQKKTFGGYKKLQSVKVDGNGMAWFMLANADKSTKYYIVINADSISSDEVLIPATLASDYGMSGGSTYLLGDDGKEYTVTGRKSSWGIDLKTVMIITIAAMVAAGGIIGLVMVLINRGKQAKMKLATAGESAEFDEDAVYMDVLRELAGEKKDKEKKAPRSEERGKEKKAPRSEEKKKK